MQWAIETRGMSEASQRAYEYLYFGPDGDEYARQLTLESVDGLLRDIWTNRVDIKSLHQVFHTPKISTSLGEPWLHLILDHYADRRIPDGPRTLFWPSNSGQ